MKYLLLLTLSFAPPSGDRSINTCTLKPGTTRSPAFATIRGGIATAHGLLANVQILFSSLDPEQLPAARAI